MHPRGALEGPCGVTGLSFDVPVGVFGSSRRVLGGPLCIPGESLEVLVGSQGGPWTSPVQGRGQSLNKNEMLLSLQENITFQVPR